MTLADAERYLLGLELFGMRFGLDRMRRLMTVLGSPQERFRSIPFLVFSIRVTADRIRSQSPVQRG